MTKGQEKGSDEIKEAAAEKFGLKGGQSSDDEPGTGQARGGCPVEENPAYRCPMDRMEKRVGMFVLHRSSKKRGEILGIGDYRYWGWGPQWFKILISFPRELPLERGLGGKEKVVDWRWQHMYNVTC